MKVYVVVALPFAYVVECLSSYGTRFPDGLMSVSYQLSFLVLLFGGFIQWFYGFHSRSLSTFAFSAVALFFGLLFHL
jgi:hypothetical protein